MKNFLLCPIVLCILVFTQTAVGQTAEMTKTPVVKEAQKWTSMKTENGINVSYHEGYLGTSRAIYLSFHNTKKENVTLFWVLKDQNGEKISEAQDFVIKSGETLNDIVKPNLNHKTSFRIKGEQDPANFTINYEIIKN